MLEEKTRCQDETIDKEIKADDCLIECNEMAVKWPTASDEPADGSTLIDISFTVGSRQLLTVVGHVGSGKVNQIIKPALDEIRIYIGLYSFLFIRARCLWVFWEN